MLAGMSSVITYLPRRGRTWNAISRFGFGADFGALAWASAGGAEGAVGLTSGLGARVAAAGAALGVVGFLGARGFAAFGVAVVLVVDM
jgi:hypothetical protein